MPQITLEFTKSIASYWDPSAFLNITHNKIANIIDTKLHNCKSRIICHEDFYIGNGNSKNAFIFLRVEILSGRTAAVKKELGENLLAILKQHVSQIPNDINLQISVYISDLDKENYHMELISL